MGARGTGSGVELRPNSVRLNFTWSGKRCRETLDLKPTPVNERAAKKMLREIQQEIKYGIFDYAKHFPNGKSFSKPGSEPVAGHSLTAPGDFLFKDYAATWLKTLILEPSSIMGYKRGLDSTWLPAFGEKALKTIKRSDIKAVIAERHEEVSGKTINNYLIALRHIFETALDDELIDADPMVRIRNLKHQAPAPDPFTQDEADQIIGRLRDQSPEQVWNYFDFAFASGMRVSELIAIKWQNVDWQAKQLRVDAAHVLGADKGTKTNRVRHIELTDQAVSALTRQKKHTFLKGLDAVVFENPQTGRAWNDDKAQRESYFQPAVRALGLRWRSANQTRHTYATTALMAGVAPAYIAQQLGHTNMGMLLKHYSKWIMGADKGRERDRLNAAQKAVVPVKKSSIVPALSPD